jgi:hypothetical protein
LEYVFRYNLRPQKLAEYAEWLAAQVSAAAPGHNGHGLRRTWIYLGTWLDIMSLGSYDYESRWRLDDRVSVRKRPLSPEAERNPPQCLEFVEAGEVAVMDGLRGVVSASL